MTYQNERFNNQFISAVQHVSNMLASVCSRDMNLESLSAAIVCFSVYKLERL